MMMLTQSHQGQVLLVDDDDDVLESWCHLLSLSGYRVTMTQNPQKALAQLSPQWDGVVVSDIYMPAMNGIDFLGQIQKIDSEIPVIMITGHADIPLAVTAVKQGAWDFLEKPLDPEKLLHLLATALPQRLEVLARREKITSAIEQQIIGSSAQINILRQHIASLAQTDKDFMLEGEPGTGRHTFAELLHSLSHRRDSPLTVHDCRLHSSLQEVSERLQTTVGGTLIFHAPEYLHASCQRWLGRELLNYERQGNKALRHIVIFDSNPDQLVEQHQLMPELYYYFSQVRLKLPRLTERKDDITALFRYFLRQCCKKLTIPLPPVENAYLAKLKDYTWPGNVRELKNVAELYAVGIVKLAGDKRVLSSPLNSGPLDSIVDDYEKKVIEDALYLFAGRLTETAEHLGIPRKKLYLKMKKYNLTKEVFKPHN
jgi:two-component system phosphoglycerate transport system response regulator PgtA